MRAHRSFEVISADHQNKPDIGADNALFPKRERILPEYHSLLAHAGLRLDRVANKHRFATQRHGGVGSMTEFS